MLGSSFLLFVFGIMALGFGLSLWRAWSAWRAAGRLLQPPPGLVMVEGTTAELGPLRPATLSGNSCLWEAWQIEHRRYASTAGDGPRQLRWDLVEAGDSRDPFLLVTPQGHRILLCPDPADAQLLPIRHWTGPAPRPDGEPGLLSQLTGGMLGNNHRYGERLVLPAQPLFALGRPEQPAPGDPPGIDGRLLPGPDGLVLGAEPPTAAAAGARRGVLLRLLNLGVMLAFTLALLLGGPWILPGLFRLFAG